METVFRRSKLFISRTWTLLWVYIFIGGLIAFALGLGGYIGPHCKEAAEASGVYETCKPCGMRYGMAHSIETNECQHPLLKTVQNVGVAVPQLFIVIASLFFYPVLEILGYGTPLFRSLRFLPALVFAQLALASARKHFRAQSNLWRELHRTTLFGSLCLAALTALSG